MNATNTNCRFAVTDFDEVKKKMLNWANRFSIFCFLDNHLYQTTHHSLECMLAAGVKSQFNTNNEGSLSSLQEFIDQLRGKLFGHFNYDLKNEIEGLSSEHTDRLKFPDIFFFEPEFVIRLQKDNLEIEADNETEARIIFDAILQTEPEFHAALSSPIHLQQRVSRQEYMDSVRQLQKHILRGDCYEINYCMEFFSDNAMIDPLHVYDKLSSISPNPFSALYKLEDKWLICASPERFLKKEGNKILSQPIKGTSSRFPDNHIRDDQSKELLSKSEKDRSENVMVVDLVRNDLSRVCVEGSVKVDELFGVYSFPQVHQMISTVSGELKEQISFTDIIRSTFPMGSMTGAPKRKVLQLIEQYERSRRGIFSGALGYLDEGGDFDFNVVIRSIMYNATSKYLSFMAGSGITFYSEAEKEYEECLWKAEAMRKVLV